MAPITSEAITPAKISSTSQRRRPGQQAEAGIAAPARRAVSARAVRAAVRRIFAQADIGHKTAPKPLGRATIHTRPHATNITVLQSFCDSRRERRSVSHLIYNEHLSDPPVLARYRPGVNPAARNFKRF